MKLDHSDPQFVSALTDAIVALAHHFCGVPIDARPPAGGTLDGFNKLAPVYMGVTEHRDGPGPAQREAYSSCGDQLHAILERVGVRAPWINRGAKHVYGSAQMTKLEPFDPKGNPGGSPASRFVPSDPSYRPPAGSLCLIWTPGVNNAHALVVLGQGSDSGHLLTANYGATGMSAALAPGAQLADSPYAWDPVHRWHALGRTKRALQTVITPETLVPYLTEQVDLTGCEVTDDLIQALGAKWEHGDA